MYKVDMNETKELTIDTCPTCNSQGLVANGEIDLDIIYDGKYFRFEDNRGNEPYVSSFYCEDCGDTFTLSQVEAHAQKLLNSNKGE